MVGAIAGFLYTFCAHSIVASLLVAVLFGAAVCLSMILILTYAFSVVYNQKTSDYEIVNLLRDKYGWQPEQPKEGDTDYSFTDNRMNLMLDDLVENHDCEYGDI